MNDKIIAVAGPTASGKSALALELCKRLDGELISLDSMQIYRGLDIGTAKPTKAEQAEVRHHMINICEPTENFSAAEFAERAHKVIADVRSRGKRAVLCGGTGLYLDTVLGRLDFGEIESDEKLRGELIAFAEKTARRRFTKDYVGSTRRRLKKYIQIMFAGSHARLKFMSLRARPKPSTTERQYPILLMRA